MVFNWFKRKFTDPAADEPTAEDDSLVEAPEAIEAEPESSPQTADGDGSPKLTSDQSLADRAAQASVSETATDLTSGSSTSDSSAEDYLAWAQAAFNNLQSQSSPETVPESVSAAAPAVVETSTPAPALQDEAQVPESSEDVLESVAMESSLDAEQRADSASVLEPSSEDSQANRPTDFPEASAAPPPSPAITQTPSTQVQDNRTEEIDEGFLWSAEILAAQGRKPEDVSVEEITWLKKLRMGLGKTRRGLVNQLKSVVGKGPLNQEAIEEIETLLLQADVGIEATDIIVESLQKKLREDTLPSDQAIAYLKQLLREMLDRPYAQGYAENFAPEKNRLNIWLMAGVNGVGKTTTIGKLTSVAKTSGYSCLIAAADTFRAAAVEQVRVWGERSQVEVICNPGQNTDPAAVVYDAISAAQSRKVELLLVDTAGRLQNKKNLMDELAKVRRIIEKKAPDAKVESLLVLDATLGQNGLRQAQVFSEAAQLTGVVLTKLDGTAKGGVALGVVQQLGLPIRFIGAGEGISDLRPFSSYEFVEALLSA